MSELPEIPEDALSVRIRGGSVQDGYDFDDIVALERASKCLLGHLEYLYESRRHTVLFAGGDPEADAAAQRLIAAVEHQYQARREFRRLYEVWPDLDRWGELVTGDPSA
jgi:hypothetical protein